MPSQTREDWPRLRDYVIARRTKLGMLHQGDLADAAGVSRRTISQIETAHSVRGSTLAALDATLQWKPGSSRAILRGGEPDQVDLSPDDAEAARIDAELREISNAYPKLTDTERRGIIGLVRGMRGEEPRADPSDRRAG